MRFSVLVPVYNVEMYLEECVNSILAQLFQDFEMILVDDGSTDRSGQVCDEFERRYPDKIRVIHKENQGLISARRVGISEAKGEFCVFIDSDDFVEFDLLETIDLCLKRDSEIDVVLYSFQYFRNGKKDKRFKIVASDGFVWDKENKKEIYEKISCGCDITSIWTKAIRTSILKSDPTDYSLYYGKNMAEDLLQSLYPLTVARKIIYTDKVLHNYRINEESISRSFRIETIEKKNTIHVYNKVLEYLLIWNLDTEIMRERVAAKWFNEAMYMFSKYYEAAKNRQDRKEVLQFDWDSFIPDKAHVLENVYATNVYKVLYSMWKNGDIKGIQRYFLKKKCYQKAKMVKRKWLKYGQSIEGEENERKC